MDAVEAAAPALGQLRSARKAFVLALASPIAWARNVGMTAAGIAAGRAARNTPAIMAFAASFPGARMENVVRRRAAGPAPTTAVPAAETAFVNLSTAKPAEPV